LTQRGEKGGIYKGNQRKKREKKDAPSVRFGYE